ncbi:MAG: type II secretion system F family protein [Patescibacteria group bacterium]
MRYKYTAADANGKVTEGILEAENTGAVLESLSAKGLKPVSIAPIKEIAVKTKRVFGQSVTVTDKVFLTKYLALMLKVGTDLLTAINILIDNFDKAILKSLLTEIRSNLEKGQPFYQSFSAYPRYFSPVFVNLVKAGEASGNLANVFQNLSVTLEKEHELQGRIKSAMIYPAILFGLSALILIFLVTFALPRIAGVFLGGGFNPPAFSRIVFSVGLFLEQYIAVFLILLAFLAVGGWLFFAKTLAGKKTVSALLNSVPVVRGVVKKIALQRFASTFGVLMKAGLPILDALEITADAVAQPSIKESLRRVARNGVAKGLTIGEAFNREKTFPSVVTNLVAISEKAGHLDEVLNTLADFYDSEISVSIKNLVAFVEPVMLILIGAVIGLIALAILVPIYQLVSQF